MISRFHVYRYANCMLLYNISTLHHRDDGTFSRINFKDASLVGLPAPRHRSLQGNRCCAVVPIHKTNISSVRLRRISTAESSPGFKCPADVSRQLVLCFLQTTMLDVVRVLAWYPIVPVPVDPHDEDPESLDLSKARREIVADAQPRAFVDERVRCHVRWQISQEPLAAREPFSTSLSLSSAVCATRNVRKPSAFRRTDVRNFPATHAKN